MAAESASRTPESDSGPVSSGDSGMSASTEVKGGDAGQGGTDLKITEQNARSVFEMLLRNDGAAPGRPKATDLHLNPGRPPDYRIERVIRSVKSKPLTANDLSLITNAMMNENQRGRFNRNHCIDMSYHLDRNRSA